MGRLDGAGGAGVEGGGMTGATLAAVVLLIDALIGFGLMMADLP